MTAHDPRAIDWPALHRRLEKVRITLDSSTSTPPDMRRKILERRAEKIAAVPSRPLDAGQELLVLELMILPEAYAVPAEFVVEAAPLREFSVLPRAPSFVLGIAHLRGRMMSVVDLRRFFALPGAGLTDQNRLVVLGHRGLEIAVAADEVRSVKTLSRDRIEEPLPSAGGNRASFCQGIAPGGIIVLDVPKLLSATNLERGRRSSEESR